MHTITDRGVVLRVAPYGEYDSILTIFSEADGRVSALAKGLRRPTSRMSGILQPFSVIAFEHSVPKTETSLSRLIRAEVIDYPKSPGHPEYFFLAEIADRLARESQPVPSFFKLLSEMTFKMDPQRTPVIFLLKTITLFGYFPVFESCPTDHVKFSTGGLWADNGEIICDRHADGAGVPLDFSEIKMLRFWQLVSFQNALRVRAPKASLGKIFHFLCSFIERQGITLKSKETVGL